MLFASALLRGSALRELAECGAAASGVREAMASLAYPFWSVLRISWSVGRQPALQPSQVGGAEPNQHKGCKVIRATCVG